MATKIRHKRSAVADKKPIVSQLESGELAINTADGKVFLLRDDNTVQDITRRIFSKDTELAVNEPDDSTSGTIDMTVDGEKKFIASISDMEFLDDVTIDNAKALKMREATASGLDSINIKAPTTLPSSYDIVLPTENGIDGQVLRLTGDGSLAFENPDVYGGNVVYVSAERGNDSNDGLNKPVRTIKRACQIASGLVYNPDGTTNGIRVNVKIAVGDYEEQNPVIVPDNTVIKGDGLRGCIIRPANANQDILRVRNACYFGEFTFRDKVDANFVPLWTGDYCVAFDDPSDATVDRVGYTNLPDTAPFITTSPYVQNCSILSFLGLNGAKIDGAKIVSPNIGLIPIEQENPVIGATPEQGKSMVANAFTMLSFGGTGWRLLNDAYAQIVSCFQIFLLNGVYTQSGGYCSITNSATNFGLYALRSSGYSPKAFVFDRAYVTATGQSEGLQTISIVGLNRTAPVEEFVLRFRDPEYKIAYDLIQGETQNIIDDTITYITNSVAAATPGDIWYLFNYDEAKCRRDLSIILDAVSRDTWATANALTRQAALAYYSQRIADSSNITISGQEEQTIDAIEEASRLTGIVLTDLDSEPRAYVDELFDLIKDAISDPDSIPASFDVSSEGEITNQFKDPPDEVLINGGSGVSEVTNIFTKTSHGLVNGEQVVYSANGNPPIQGLDEEQTYYVKLINLNEFSLTFDDSLEFDVNIIATSSGTHKFLTNIKEFFVKEVISSHTTYQKLILPSGSEGYAFVPGRQITATTGAANNRAIVYSWTPNLRELVVSIEEVAVGESTQRVQFSNLSIIDDDHTPSPFSNIGVNEVQPFNGYSTATFTIEPTVAGELLTNLVALPEKAIWLHRPSIVNSSSHTWEFAGSGTDYNALPQNGGNTRTEFEQFEELPGRCYSSGTNELGDFKVGDFITAFNRTGNITFRNKVQVDELDALRLSLSNVAIEEISTSVNLGDDEIGGPSDARLSTQLATRSFLSNRLGGFIDKSVSTAAVPGAIVQLNTNGQLNPDLIPATRQFTSTNTDGYLSRLTQVDEIPAIDLKAGDIGTEEYDQIELTFSSPISATDGDLITQPTTGAVGYAKGDYASSTNLLVASLDNQFKPGEDSTGTDFDTTNNIFIAGVDSGQAPLTLGAVSEITDNFFLKSSNSSQYLVLDSSGAPFNFTVETITDVERTSNVATITTSGNHNLSIGNNVEVECDDTLYNVNGLVTSVPSSTTFTIANTGSNEGSKSATGTVRTIVTSADGNAQGAVTETRYGICTNVDNANITGGSGYTPTLGTLVYEMVDLQAKTGVGTGAKADVTVTAGQISDVDLRRGGTGYAVGDLLELNASDVGGTGSGFEIEIAAIEDRAYVNILGGELYVASASSIDFIEDNDAVSSKINITLDDSIVNQFLAGTTGGGGNVDYTLDRITMTAHGYTDGDPIRYNTLGNVAIGGLLNGSVYYAKRIDADTIEVYEDFSLLNQIEFLTTPANNAHQWTRFNVNIYDNSIIVPNHGLTTGDAIRIEEEDDGSSGTGLFSINGVQVVSGARFFIGSVTTNSVTLHTLRSDALSSINGLVTNASDITATGTGDAEVIPNNVQVNVVINTSSRLKANWNTLAVTNIDASNIISGTISPSRLGASGIASSDTFLRGDSAYAVAVQTLTKASTTDNPITLTGPNTSGDYYGAVDIGISNADYDPGGTYSTLGTSRFFQAQFDVDAAGSGQVFIKDGVVDAGTLDGLDSSYFLNPANLTSNVPVNRGGTNLSTYADGDLIYAQTSGTLNSLNIGREGNILVVDGGYPVWGDAVDIIDSLDIGAADTGSKSTATGKVYNENLTTVEISGEADVTRIGASTTTRAITSFIDGYDAATSQVVAVNLNGFSRTTNENVNNTDDFIPLSSTATIEVGMVVTGSASIQANTVVSGVADDVVYIDKPTVGTIPTTTSLTFTYTPEVLGIRAGDFVTIASSGVASLDGTWPVLGATINATSFTVQTELNVTVSSSGGVAGSAEINNKLIVKHQKVIFGDAEASATPADVEIHGAAGIGTDIGGGEIKIIGGLGTGAGTGGDFVVETGTVTTTSDFIQSPTERLRIDTSGVLTYTGYAVFTTSTGLKIPVGTSAQRPGETGVSTAAAQGQIRYNTSDSTFEGYDGSNWGSLGGVKDVDQDTKIEAESSAGADNDELDFYTAGTQRMQVASTGNLLFGDGLNKFTIDFTTGDTTIDGNLTVNGTTVTLNTTTLDVEDLNITVAKGAANAAAADGAGLTVDAANATWTYDATNTSWDSSEDINLVSGKAYYINDVSVLNSTTLGANIVNSSLTVVGTLNTGAISSGFGNINIGSSNLTATGTVSLGATSFNDNNITNVGTISLDTIQKDAGTGINFATSTIVTVSDTTESTLATDGALVVAGGVGIAKKLRVGGIIYGDGSGLTNLNASQLLSGTIPDAVLPTSQSGKTFTSDITVNGHLIGEGGGSSATNFFAGGGAAVTTGIDSVGVGDGVFGAVLTGNQNTGVGKDALALATASANNTAMGAYTLSQIDAATGGNTAIGAESMQNSITANANVAIGYKALEIANASNNVIIGYGAGATITTGSNNIVIGKDAAPTANTTNNEITLGNASHANVRIPGVGLTVNTTTLSFSGTTGFAGVGSSLTALNASQLTSGTVPDGRISSSSVTQHETDIDAVGTLNAGAISSGFGNINIGTSTFTGNGSGLTTLNASNLSSGTVAGARLGGNQSMSGIKTFSNTTQASSTTTGAVKVSGGVGIAKNLHVGGTITGNGSGLTSLNASNLSSGTVPNARISGSYTSITGTGALNAGQITSGFGNINIGTSTFTGNGSGLTNVSADTLDGIDSTQFLRSDANDTASGVISLVGSGAQRLVIRNTTNAGGARIDFTDHASNTQYGRLNFEHSDGASVGSGYGASFKFQTTEPNLMVAIDGPGDFYVNGNKVWHAGNDGAGSGLDADTVDGQDIGDFVNGAGVDNGATTIKVNDADFIVQDTTDGTTNYIWRDHSANTLYLGTGNAVPTLRSTLNMNSNNITNGGTISGTFSGNGASITSINAGNITSGTFPDRFSPSTRYNIGLIDGYGGNSYDKLRVWSSSSYTIGMISAQSYGWLNDYAMTFTMNADNDRGFLWRDTSDAASDGAMSLTTAGNLMVKNVIGIGGNTSNYIAPANGQNYGTFRAEGVYGTSGSYAGWSIRDDWVFMSNGAGAYGIYNDTNNEWSLYGQQNSYTYIYYNGAWKARAQNEGWYVNGQLLATSEVTAYYSDERLKTFTGKLEGALDKVKALNGYLYVENETAKKYGYNNDNTQVGVSAQEVQKVLPEAVVAAPFDLDEDGNSKSGEDYLTVKYERMVPLLIEAVKEADDKIEAQAAEIAELKAMVQKLIEKN